MSDNKYFKWTVEISIHPTWVADGFDLTDERVHDMVQQDLGWAYPHEIECKVVKSPDSQRIKKEQGYE